MKKGIKAKPANGTKAKPSQAEIERLLISNLTVPPIIAGAAYGLGKNASYAAVKNGQIAAIEHGSGKKKYFACPTAPIRKDLGIVKPGETV